MADTIWVIEGANGPVHRPEVDRAHRLDQAIAGTAPVEVENNRFYRRRVAVGDLVKVPAPAAAARKV